MTNQSTDLLTENDIDRFINIVADEESNLLENLNEKDIQAYLEAHLSDSGKMEFLSGNQAAAMLASAGKEIDDSLELPTVVASAMSVKGRALFNYKKLKRTVRKVFCDIIASLEGLDTKGIIKAILLALVPALGAGIPALLAPIIVGIILWFLAKGYESVCPV